MQLNLQAFPSIFTCQCCERCLSLNVFCEASIVVTPWIDGTSSSDVVTMSTGHFLIVQHRTKANSHGYHPGIIKWQNSGQNCRAFLWPFQLQEILCFLLASEVDRYPLSTGRDVCSKPCFLEFFKCFWLLPWQHLATLRTTWTLLDIKKD